MNRILIILSITCGLLFACSPPFPKDLLDKITTKVPYEVLHKDPDQYKGSLLMVGGMIVETKNLKQATRIEVLQKPLDSQGRPYETDKTGGRFLVTTDQYLDAAVYYPGRIVTVIGEVTGLQVLPLGETEYRYPEVRAKSIHLWSPSSGPRFTFGVGVGVYRGF